MSTKPSAKKGTRKVTAKHLMPRDVTLLTAFAYGLRTTDGERKNVDDLPFSDAYAAQVARALASRPAGRKKKGSEQNSAEKAAAVFSKWMVPT